MIDAGLKFENVFQTKSRRWLIRSSALACSVLYCAVLVPKLQVSVKTRREPTAQAQSRSVTTWVYKSVKLKFFIYQQCRPMYVLSLKCDFILHIKSWMLSAESDCDSSIQGCMLLLISLSDQVTLPCSCNTGCLSYVYFQSKCIWSAPILFQSAVRLLDAVVAAAHALRQSLSLEILAAAVGPSLSM